MDELSANSSTTTLNKIEFSYFWKIENFSNFTAGTLRSDFFNHPASNLQWYLTIHTQSSDSPKTIILNSLSPTKLKASFTLEVELKIPHCEESASGLKKRQHNSWVRGCLERYKCNNVPKYRYVRCYKFLFNHAIMHVGPLPDGILTIECRIVIIEYQQPKSLNPFEQLSPPMPSPKDCKNNIIPDLRRCYQNRILTDVTITSGGTVFKVHKAILAARSKVLCALFTNELNVTTLNFDDWNVNAIRAFIDYLYGSLSPSDSTEFAEELLILSDKYFVDSLKVICEYELIAKVDVNYAVYLLIFAHTYDAKILELVLINYIVDNIDRVSLTPEWGTLLPSHNKLLTTILTKRAKRRRVTKFIT